MSTIPYSSTVPASGMVPSQDMKINGVRPGSCRLRTVKPGTFCASTQSKRSLLSKTYNVRVSFV